MAELVVGERRFASLSAAGRFYRAMWTKYRPPAVIDADDFVEAMALLRRHPRAAEKLGPGVARIIVMPGLHGRSYTLFAERVDGTVVDWSYRECIQPASTRADVAEAMRFTIVEQIQDFRQSEGAKHVNGLECPITGAWTMLDDVEVDHDQPTFVELAQAFLSSEGLADRLQGIELTRHGIGVRLADPALRERWWWYHYHKARLRLVSTKGNRTRKRAPQWTYS